MKSMLLSVILVIFATSVGAQNARTKTFPMATPIPEQAIVVCSTVESALAIAKSAETPVGLKIYLHYLTIGTCDLFTGTIVYTRLVHRDTISVYEGRTGSRLIYVPTNWSGDST